MDGLSRGERRDAGMEDRRIGLPSTIDRWRRRDVVAENQGRQSVEKDAAISARLAVRSLDFRHRRVGLHSVLHGWDFYEIRTGGEIRDAIHAAIVGLDRRPRSDLLCAGQLEGDEQAYVRADNRLAPLVGHGATDGAELHERDVGRLEPHAIGQRDGLGVHAGTSELTARVAGLFGADAVLASWNIREDESPSSVRQLRGDAAWRLWRRREKHARAGNRFMRGVIADDSTDGCGGQRPRLLRRLGNQLNGGYQTNDKNKWPRH